MVVVVVFQRYWVRFQAPQNRICGPSAPVRGNSYFMQMICAVLALLLNDSINILGDTQFSKILDALKNRCNTFGGAFRIHECDMENIAEINIILICLSYMDNMDRLG